MIEADKRAENSEGYSSGDSPLFETVWISVFRDICALARREYERAIAGVRSEKDV